MTEIVKMEKFPIHYWKVCTLCTSNADSLDNINEGATLNLIFRSNIHTITRLMILNHLTALGNDPPVHI